MNWRVVNLSAEDFEENVLGAIQNLFERIWQAMGSSHRPRAPSDKITGIRS